jgi:hypothetical protein
MNRQENLIFPYEKSDLEFLLYWAQAGINYFGENNMGKDYARFQKIAEELRKSK